MLDQLFNEIYTSSLSSILTFISIIVLAWSILGATMRKRIRSVAAIITVLSVAIIIFATIFKRTPGDLKYDFIPFSSFQRAIIQPEIYRSMLMNVFIFVPLGMSLVCFFNGGTSNRIILTVLIGFFMSVLIETVQYYFSLGLAETDDVICNTIGTLIGSSAYPLSLLWRRLFERFRKRSSDVQDS